LTLYCYVDGPVGRLLVAGDRTGVKRIHFPTSKKNNGPEPGWQENPRPFQGLIDDLKRYFAGGLRRFSLNGVPQGTVFQRKVWRALGQVPYGATATYGQVARAIGRPNAARAVGAACGQNPLSIVIPCHRVVGQTGKLTGFGGGLAAKQTLLTLEQRNAHSP